MPFIMHLATTFSKKWGMSCSPAARLRGLDGQTARQIDSVGPVEIIEAAGRYADPGDAGVDYVEHLRRPDLSVGTYSLRAGAVDDQSPHTEDEVYVVTSGRARFTSGGQTVAVGPGTTLFVPAHEEHRFHDITEDLALIVFFGPAYGARSAVGRQGLEP